MRGRGSAGQSAGEVGAITALKSQPRAEEALALLRKIHSLVKPIMKNHGWYLPVLAEFFPSNPNLLGINVNRGAKICIRLRPAHDPSSFLPLEDSLLGTMLHELTHNVRGPHDDAFFRQLDALQEEFYELKRKGYVEFLGAGNRVGEGVRGDGPGGLREARERALRRLEEREKVPKVLGTGGRLGGAVPDARGKRRGEILAEAAERRLRAQKACGGDDAHNHPSGSKQEDLPADVQEDINRAERNEQRVVLDLTGASSDEEEEDAPVAGPSRLQPERVTGKAKREQSSSPELEVLPPKRAAPAAANADRAAPPPAKRRGTRPPAPAARSSPSPLVRDEPSVSSSRSTAGAAPSSARSHSPAAAASATGPPTWTCPLCTFDNRSPLALACEVCLTERPLSTLPPMVPPLFAPPGPAAAARLPPGPVRRPLPPDADGWSCAACTTVNQHLFWSCAACGVVKRSSAVG